MFLYGHRVKVKITAAKRREISYSLNVKLRSSIHRNSAVLYKIEPCNLRA